jgi:uncharacterized protein (DUF1501 family)
MKRREFLSNTSKTIALGSIIPGFSFSAIHQQSALGSLLAPIATNNDHVLVIIQMNGGNDGLNTLIPLDQYTNLNIHRANVLIKDTKVLKLNGTANTGIHPAMTALQTMYNEGKVNFVQGVGYPSQNYSHFRSTDIWLSGSDADKYVNSGWMGRYLNAQFPNYPDAYPTVDMPDPLAIQIGALISAGFQGPTPGPGIPMAVSITSDKDFYDLVNGAHSTPGTNAIGKELAYIREVSNQAQTYNTAIKNAALKVTSQSTYPTGNNLADQLKIVAKLIKGGLKTKIYMVNIGGFDTHSTQVDPTDTSLGTHAKLLGQLSEAISAFQKDLKYLNIEDKVIGMTFSEFGRRIISNGSAGTDHGSALPMMFFGTNVQNGIIGTNPQIAASFTGNDNLAMQYDFRSVYASVLKQWFCIDDTSLNEILFKNYQTLPILKNSACTTGSISSYQSELEVKRLQCYPNPFGSNDTVKIDINTSGGEVLIEIYTTEGRLVDTIENKKLQPGVYTYNWKNEQLPSGFYYCRMQNEDYQNVFTLQKVRD